jgi:hypothetical protein
MARSTSSNSQMNKVLDATLVAHDIGFRILADWFNKAFIACKIDVRIDADPPPPTATLRTCKQTIANALLAIRPFAPDLPPDDKLWPWALGHLNGKRDEPSQSIAGVTLELDPNWPNLESADDIENEVSVKQSYGWTEASSWRAYVVEPMLDRRRVFRSFIEAFRTNTRSTAPKRSTRAAAIEALTKELIDHLIAARDHAFATKVATGTPRLLPRPTQTALAKQLGLTKSCVTRCLQDKTARQLQIYWALAVDLHQIMAWKGPVSTS